MPDAITKLRTGAVAQPAYEALPNLTLALIRKPPPKRLSHHRDSRPLQFERGSQTGSSLGSLVSSTIHRAETITRSQIHSANTKHGGQESPRCSSRFCLR